MILEPVVAALGIIVCWILGMVVYEDDMPLGRYAVLGILAVVALYFFVRIVHWAWLTPIPFVGR
jgi:hypothetical protein